MVDASQSRQMWRERLGLTTEKLIVAGSTHEGEERMLLGAFASLRETMPDLRLALAPRHLDRAQAVASQIEGTGLGVARRSHNQALDEDSVYLLDSVGELADFYAAGDVAFVGGTLISRGGHNLLEPVVRGVPVVFGPSVQNFRAAAELVLKERLGAQTTEDELAATFRKWLEQPDTDFANRVDKVLAPHRGAAARMAKAVLNQIS